MDLEPIKARLAAASAGPWAKVPDDPRIEGPDMTIYDEGGHTEADAEFIAAARDDVPRLIAEIERLRTRNPLSVLLDSCYRFKW